jgi:hypothetical protein
VLPETLEVLLVVYLVFVIEREDRLRARVGRIPKLEG